MSISLEKYPIESIKIKDTGDWYELGILTKPIVLDWGSREHIVHFRFGVAYALHLPDDMMEIVCLNPEQVVWVGNEVFHHRENFNWQILFKFMVFDANLATQLKLMI